jgi:glycosyltransferase involved in cell wall biosynthesis
MALGKPLIAAAEGGPLEIVEDGKSGLLVRRDVDAYAAAIERLLTDQPLADRLSAGARARAGTFSEERLGREFADLLFSVARGAR